MPETEIKLGAHHFPVHTQPFALTLVPHDTPSQKGLALHLLGTNFWEEVRDAKLNALINYREQTLVAESAEVYRSEYLAASLLFNHWVGADGDRLENLPMLTTQYALDHADEGYVVGIHDVDAARLLEQLLPLLATVGLLRFTPWCRSVAQLFWVFSANPEAGKLWERTVQRWSQLQPVGGEVEPLLTHPLMQELTPAIAKFLREQPILSGLSLATDWVASSACEYLVEELKNESLSFITSTQAQQWVESFWQALDQQDKRRQFEDDLRAFKPMLPQQFAVVQTWLTSYAKSLELNPAMDYYLPEAVTLLLIGKRVMRRVSEASAPVVVTELKGTHPRLHDQTLTVQLEEFWDRLQHFQTVKVPAYHAYQQLCQTILEEANKRLRLEQWLPQPSPTFVYHRLLQEVHNPVIGANLAKQLGTVNQPPVAMEAPFLLLLSPPGFGKTQLVEYLAHRLGLLLVRLNGFRLGTAVTSLDPATAPHAQARGELAKLHFGLTLGNNVLLLIDDIQGCHPEFLQALLPLTERQRPIEGPTGTYDLRNQRFGIILAGSLDLPRQTVNLPPVLLQRVDICQLGRIPEGQEELFARSYLENAWPACPLSQAISSSLKDTVTLTVPPSLQKLSEIIFKIHQHYETSLLESENCRTAPPFQLLGSYRTMNLLATQMTADMTDSEVEKLVTNHYVKEAQLLTTGREENLLKLAEICGNLTPPQATRWAEIKGRFQRWQNLADQSADPVNRVVNQLSLLGERLHQIQVTLLDTVEMKPLLAHLATLPNLLNVLSNSQLEINVVNQLPSGWEDSLRSMIEMVEKTLLPIVQDYERKSKLDLVIFERVNEMAEMLRELHREGVAKGKVQKQYKPLSFKD